MGSDADFAVCTAIVSKVKTTNDLRIYQHVSEYLVKFKKKKVREGHVWLDVETFVFRGVGAVDPEPL